jgi:hypothetical protein
MLTDDLAKIHKSHLIETNSFETRLKYCIQYRGVIPEGRERSVFHLVEIICLRYHHTSLNVDIYDHNSHLLASFSNWLFEHFPEAKSAFPLIARRRWHEATKYLNPPLKQCINSAPIFGNARQMASWRQSLFEQCHEEDQKLISGDLDYIRKIVGLNWLEKLSIAAIFSMEPIFDLSKHSLFFFDRNDSQYDKILLDILCNNQVNRAIIAFYTKPEDLWLPVHINIILNEPINEPLFLRFVQHLLSAESSKFLNRIFAFDYLLRCKENGDTASKILVNYIGSRLNGTERQLLMEKIVSLKLESLQEDVVLFWNFLDTFLTKIE